jgi:hypothetical protein
MKSREEKLPITSFDAGEVGIFGDVLTREPTRRRPQIGFLALGYFEYWRMYPELEHQVRAGFTGRLGAPGSGLAGMRPGFSRHG